MKTKKIEKRAKECGFELSHVRVESEDQFTVILLRSLRPNTEDFIYLMTEYGKWELFSECNLDGFRTSVEFKRVEKAIPVKPKNPTPEDVYAALIELGIEVTDVELTVTGYPSVMNYVIEGRKR